MAKRLTTVRVRAINLKPGDVMEGARIQIVQKYSRRPRKLETHVLDRFGVLVVKPHTSGYDLDTTKLVGSQYVKVQRPKYNMKYRRKPKA